jgi:hypothetical protein
MLINGVIRNSHKHFLRYWSWVSRSRAWTVFGRSNTGVVGSDLTWGVDVCLHLFCVCAVLYVGRHLETSWPPSKGYYRPCIVLENWKKQKKTHRAQKWVVDPLINKGSCKTLIIFVGEFISIGILIYCKFGFTLDDNKWTLPYRP